MATNGSADGIVVIDDSAVIAQFAAQKASIGIASDSAAILSQKQATFTSMKSALLGRAPSGSTTVIQDYSHFATQLVHFATPDALVAVLSDATVVVRANRAMEPALSQSLPLVSQPAAALAGYTGSGTAVAVIDTQIDFTQADLGSCTAINSGGTCKVVDRGQFWAYAVATAGCANTPSTSTHGTNVSSIAARVAPGTRILDYNVFAGTCNAYQSDQLDALNRTITTQATWNTVAVNMSLGSGTNSSACTGSYAASAFTNVRSAGIIPVVASGNNGSSSGIASPACTPGALSVGAVWDGNNGGPWTFSGGGPCTDNTTAADQVTCFSQSASILSMLAPGAFINAGGVSNTGTSQATPHVSGAVAVLAAASPSSTVSQRENAAYGFGVTDSRNGLTRQRLDVCYALQGLMGSSKCGAAISSPSPNSTLSGSSVNFSWNSVPGATLYYVYAGNTVGGSQYFSNTTTSTSINITGLPTNGSTVRVRLLTMLNGWLQQIADYTYTAYTFTLTVPTVTTPTKTNITSTAATLGGNITNEGGTCTCTRGVVYSSSNSDPDIGEGGVTNNSTSGNGTGTFTRDITGLTPNTTYYFKAYATNNTGTGYTAATSFTTSAAATAPTITSPTSTNVTSGGATLGGNVTSDGGANITERGVVLARTSQDSTPTIGEAFVQQVFASGTTGVFTVSSPALNANTQYSYSAYAKNSVGTSYTTPATFTTLAGTTVPTVINPSQTSITQTSALLGGTATSDGGAAITARGVVYSSTNSDPDIGESGVVVVAEGGTGGGTFTTSVGGLSPNTTYYFKAYATNSVGTGYTFVGAFTTDAPAGSPPTLITPTYTGVTSSNATLGGNITSSGSSAITERGVVFAKSSENGAPIVGGPNTTKVIAGGTATGVFTTGVSGLQAGVQYSFRAYAINGAGTATSPINTFSTTPAWTQTVGRANDVGIGANGTVFVVGTDARPGGYGIYQWNGSGWTNIPGAALRISVGPDGSPWIVNDAGLIYHRVGGVWQLLPGRAKDIGVGADGSVFVIGVDVRPGGYGVYQWNGSAWVNVPGAGIRIAVGPDGTPWLVNDAGQIYHRVGGVWQLLPGRAKDIAVSAVGAMWVIGNNAKPGGYGVFRFNGTSYDAMPGAGINIAVGPTGTPWLTNDGSVIYRGASIQPNPSDAPDLPVQQ